jgi:hypothetical protein
MLLKDTEKNTLIGECKIIILSCLLTTDCDTVLALRVLYIVYGWKSRSLRSLKDSLPPLPDLLQLVQVPPIHLYTIRYNRKFWEELIVYFLLIQHGPHRELCIQQFFIAVGMSLPSCYLAVIGGYTDRPTETYPTIFLLLCVFVTVGTCLASHCLAVKGGIHFTELCLTIEGIHIQTHRLMVGIYEIRHWDGPRCHHTHTKFHKDWFRYPEVIVIGGIDRHTDSMEIT